MELLLLGSLRYLGRGWTFDDLAESTFVRRDVHRCFFHKFCAVRGVRWFCIPCMFVFQLRYTT
jgi:hypothetical protein